MRRTSFFIWVKLRMGSTIIWIIFYIDFVSGVIFQTRMDVHQRDSMLYQKILVGFLYFLQGVFLVIPSTTILTYKQMPSYSILALFSFASLPFSFKFIAAPLIEKYTISSYGRRKSWVVISLTLASIILYLATYFTQEEQQTQRYLAMCLTMATFMIAIEDISTDALAVKELNSTELASYMQCVMQPVGAVVGSLFYLQLVSGTLYQKFGLTQPFLTVPQYFSLLSALTFASGLVIHWSYKQKTNEEQKKNAEDSLLEVIKHYKYFVNPKYRLCRQCIAFLVQFHGLVYFSSSFTVELIKSNTISKDVLTTLSNFMIIPVFFITTILRKHWSQIALIHKRTRILLLLRLSLMCTVFITNPQSPVILYSFILALSLLSNTQFFLNSMICNNFTQSKFAGMYVTMMASFVNFGNNSTIQLEVISYFGYQKAVIFGFCFAAVVGLGFGRVENWIKSGLEQEQEKGEEGEGLVKSL